MELMEDKINMNVNLDGIEDIGKSKYTANANANANESHLKNKKIPNSNSNSNSNLNLSSNPNSNSNNHNLNPNSFLEMILKHKNKINLNYNDLDFQKGESSPRVLLKKRKFERSVGDLIEEQCVSVNGSSVVSSSGCNPNTNTGNVSTNLSNAITLSGNINSHNINSHNINLSEDKSKIIF